jgi:hypothetical protein
MGRCDPTLVQIPPVTPEFALRRYGYRRFSVEEFYVVGPGDKTEYQNLRRILPSYRDIFELTAIDLTSDSQWCMFHDELKAHVRRKTDGKEFILGLSELKARNKGAQEYQFLHDSSVWLVNYR